MTPFTTNQAAAVTFSILPCQSKRDRKLFEQIPELLHAANPSFTPPFPGSVVKLISPEGTFVKQHGEITPLIAYRNNKPVGRIAAIINRSYNNYKRPLSKLTEVGRVQGTSDGQQKSSQEVLDAANTAVTPQSRASVEFSEKSDHVGFFGFFDCINDPIVAKALMEEAANIVKEKGMTILRGPYNPSINDDCGLLTEGFHEPSLISMPWNPSYYIDLYTAAGLHAVRTLYAWMVPLQKEPPARVNKIVDRLRKRAKVTIRSIDLKNLKNELAIIHRLYNRTLDRNWGFYPISLEDLLHAADDLKAIADPSLILFACIDGCEVAFSMSLPNVNEVFHAARKRKGLIRFLEMALRLQFQKIKEARLCVLGVDPGYRDKGLSALLFYEAYCRTKAKYERSEVSWVEANNTEILEGAELMGGHRSKTYQIFERELE